MHSPEHGGPTLSKFIKRNLPPNRTSGIHEAKQYSLTGDNSRPPACSESDSGNSNETDGVSGNEYSADSDVLDEETRPHGSQTRRKPGVRSVVDKSTSRRKAQATVRDRPVYVNRLKITFWSNELKRFQYLYEQSKIDSVVAARVYERLLEIDSCKEHPFVTPEVLASSEVARLIKQFRHSPYDKQTKVVADRIYKCWRNLCRDR